MTAEEPIRPATDLEIAKIGAWNCDCSTKGPNHIWSCLMNFGPRLIARIEAQAATIREQAATIASEKAIADRADELWRQTEAALRAQNAAQAEEIEKLRKVRTGSAVERLHLMHKQDPPQVTHYWERGSDPDGYAASGGRTRCTATIGMEYRKYRTNGDMQCRNRAGDGDDLCPIHSRLALPDKAGTTIATRAEEIADKSNTISQYRDACSRYLDRAERAEARAKVLEQVLRGLVAVNEEWNAVVEKTIGRAPHWNDGYLDAARATLSKSEPGR